MCFLLRGGSLGLQAEGFHLWDYREDKIMKQRAFTPLEKTTGFSRWYTDFYADGGLMPPSAKTVRGQSSLTGFTLMEIIVVIAVIGVLSAIIAPNAFKAIRKAQVVRTLQSFKNIKQATLSYYVDTGTWVADHYILDATGPFFRDPGVVGWDGPYLENYQRSPFVSPGLPVGSHPGWYYVLADSQEYNSTFDLDGDGNFEINDGISVCCYGFPAEDAYRLDEIIDGTSQWGYHGIMNVIRIFGTSPTESYYLVSMFIGQNGIPRPDRS
ncbi:MAG: prepilin-type N-terminal cleavage/methylation domain-containing protein [Candidatus Omnitrophota bacterium]